ncbi:MAG: ComEA family DNA-binding protein [Dehalococcoidales bacterium]|nr:ComEA family DNA-binding protein [Dehalococcoidales bacterium]
MKEGKLDRYWTLINIILVAIIVVGSIFAWVKYRPSRGVEISVLAGQEIEGSIYIDGAVTIPGCFPFAASDSIGALIQAAGSTTDSADLNGLKLYIPTGGAVEPQKIDINRAEAWLLETLPGIGETLAQRIVSHRQQNGPFLNIRDLLKVTGIGASTYEEIKDKITVND